MELPGSWAGQWRKTKRGRCGIARELGWVLEEDEEAKMWNCEGAGLGSGRRRREEDVELPGTLGQALEEEEDQEVTGPIQSVILLQTRRRAYLPLGRYKGTLGHYSATAECSTPTHTIRTAHANRHECWTLLGCVVTRSWNERLVDALGKGTV